MTNLSASINPKLSETVIEQLKPKNVCTVVQFINEDPEKLATITGLSFKDILEIRGSILQKCGGNVTDALDLLEIEESNIVSTGLLKLDNLLNGGLYPGQIYEVSGLSSSGKTQLCFTIAANVALNPTSIVRYIDTKRDFCGSRVEQILSKKNSDKQIVNESLERIKVCYILNLHKLFEVLRWLAVALKEEREESRTRIIIIDCLPAIVFRVSRNKDVMVALNHLANICRFIASEYRLSIISINLITQWVSSNSEGSANVECGNVTPTLGKYWTHVPNTRLLLEKIQPAKRNVLVWKSHQLKENSACKVAITDSGIVCL